MFLSYVHYGLESWKAFLNRAVYIFLSESFTCRSEDSYFLYLGSQCSLHTLCIRHEYWIAYIGMLSDQPKDFSTVCELGNRLWWNERGSFNHRETSRWKSINQFYFSRSGNKVLFILETVSWADLNNFDAFREVESCAQLDWLQCLLVYFHLNKIRNNVGGYEKRQRSGQGCARFFVSPIRINREKKVWILRSEPRDGGYQNKLPQTWQS